MIAMEKMKQQWQKMSFANVKERNHQWGLRELNHVTAIAAKAGFNTENVVSMPANNLTLVFQRA